MASYIEYYEIGEKQKQDKLIRTNKQNNIRDVYYAVTRCVTRSLVYMSRNVIRIPNDSRQVEEYARYFGPDDRSFRAWFRSLVHNLTVIVPAWQMEREDSQHAVMYLRIYHVLDQVIREVTGNNDKDFHTMARDNYFNDFIEFKGDEPAPYDIWRRIHLCACSPFWQTITIRAIHRLAALAARDESARLGVDSVVRILPDQEHVIFPDIPKEFLAKTYDKRVREERIAREQVYCYE